MRNLGTDLRKKAKNSSLPRRIERIGFKSLNFRLLSLIITLAFTGWSGNVMADDGPTLANVINTYGTGGGSGGALIAVWNASTQTVTVTNTNGVEIMGATQSLTLDIDAGITVLWQAELTGSTVSNIPLVTNTGNGAFEVISGKVQQTGPGLGIMNDGLGSVIIYDGTVSATTGNAVVNGNNGAVTVSGGTVSATTGVAIYNNFRGTVTISDSAFITSANATQTRGTVYLRQGLTTTLGLIMTGGTVENTATSHNAKTINNDSEGTVTISGGTVSATGYGRAIQNHSTGTVNVSGGTVSATTGFAIYNNSEGVITVSDSATITSANLTDTQGTILLADAGTATDPRLIMTGGTVENTATGTPARAIFNASTGAVNISGGTVSAAGNGRAIQNHSTGTVNISGGTVNVTTGRAINNQSTGTVNLSGGAVNVTDNGVAIYNITNGVVLISDSAAIIANSTQSIIRVENVGTETAPRLIITGGTIENTSSGHVITNNSVGAITISGGTVRANTGRAISNANNGLITISDSAFLTSAQSGGLTGGIRLDDTKEDSAPRLIMTGGTVEFTGSAGSTAIVNVSLGSIEISGGTVRAMNGSGAVANIYGNIVISETDPVNFPTFITSDAQGGIRGTITLGNSNTNQLFISGGIVENTSDNIEGRVIFNRNIGDSTVVISGGIVRATGAGVVIRNENTGGTVISGGEVAATTNNAIHNQSTGAVTVSGGLVRANEGYAVFCSNASANLTVNGTAALFAYGENMSDVISHSGFSGAIADDAVVITWDEAAYAGSYPQGSNDDLTWISNGEMDVYWDFVQNKSGITYTNPDNTGFIDISAVLVRIPIVITTESLPNGKVGEAYSQTITYTGGNTAPLWDIPDGTLPAGLNINTNTGVISGTPTIAGTFNFTVLAVEFIGAQGFEVSKELSITIEEKDAVYNPYDIAIINALIANNGLDAEPDAPETWDFAEWVTVGEYIYIKFLYLHYKNLFGSASFAGMQELLYLQLNNNNLEKIDASGCAKLWSLFCYHYSNHGILSELLIDGCPELRNLHCNSNQLTELDVSGSPMIEYLHVQKNRLTALDLTNQNNLQIAGYVGNEQEVTLKLTQSAPGEYTLAIPLNNPSFDNSAITYANGILKSTDNTLLSAVFEVETGKHNFLVAGTMNFEYLDFAFPQIITDELPDGTQNEEYSATLAATGITPITWSIKNGQLPDGLSINPETGEISGIPTEEGTFEFTVRAENEAGYDEKDFSIFIVKVGINGTEILGIRIYPNPTAGELRITNYELKGISAGELQITNYELKGISAGELQITNYELKGISVIDIFDVTGRNVFNTKTQRREVSNCEIVLDISDLPAGVYFLRVGNEMVKVVKK